MYAYAQTRLDEEIIKLTSFSSGDKLFAFIREVSMVSKDTQISSQNKCQPFSKLL